MEIKEITTGLRFPEGPIAMDDGSVIVVEIARGTLSRVAPDGQVSVIAETGGGPNGAAIGPDRMTLALYIDGVEVDAKVVEATLLVADPTIETVIGDPEKVYAPGKLSPPVILDTRLDAFTPWTLDSFSQELCKSI